MSGAHNYWWYIFHAPLPSRSDEEEEVEEEGYTIGRTSRRRRRNKGRRKEEKYKPMTKDNYDEEENVVSVTKRYWEKVVKRRKE